MGNRPSFIVGLIRNFIHLVLVLSISFTGITFTPAYAADGDDKLNPAAETLLLRIARSESSNSEVMSYEIPQLSLFTNSRIAEVALDRLILEINTFPEISTAEYRANKEKFDLRLDFIEEYMNLLEKYFEIERFDELFLSKYPEIYEIALRIKNQKLTEIFFEDLKSEEISRQLLNEMDSKAKKAGKSPSELLNQRKPKKPEDPKSDENKPEETKSNKVSHDLPPEAANMLDAIETLKPILEFHKIEDLKRYDNPIIAERAIWRLQKELEREILNVDILDGLTALLNGLLSRMEYNKDVFRSHEKEFQAIKELYDQKIEKSNSRVKSAMGQLIRRASNYREYDKGSGAAGNLKAQFKIDPGTAIAVIDNGKFEDPEVRLKKFRDFLERKIIEQPEVIDALYDLEFETLIKGKGNTAEPPFFYLMGLPGVGKDTSAEAYIEALYGGGVAAKEHMFHVPLQRSKSDAWSLLGSATGYVGSAELSPFIKFLVKHSAGRYQIVEGPGGASSGDYVQENPEWKPGMVLDGYSEPEKAIVFLNEFHNWSAEAKAVVMKESLEKGTFKINNPGKGINRLVVPGVRFIAASNEGIDLYTNRDFDGSRYGEPLSYEEMMERWEKVAHNKDRLRQTIAKTASKNPPGTPRDEQIGTPEEILSRIHPSRMVLMRPISPEGLKKIVRLRIEKINEQLHDATRGAYGSFEIKPTEALVEFIQKYEYSAEEGARPVGDKVRALMEYTFYQALKEAKVTPQDLKGGITLDIKNNEDKTSSLLILKGTHSAPTLLREQVIRETLKERDNRPISDEKIDSLLTLEERLKDRVFGAEQAIEKVSRAMLLSEEARHTKKKNWNDHEKATSFAFFGPSSTGKSEMAKALINELYPQNGEQMRVDIDGNQIKNQYHMEEFFWGRKEGRNTVPSTFMKKYDQYNGNLVLVIEEATNIPKDLQKSFYDLFRENHPKFADGKDRPMTNVTIIMTGNAGIEWYSGVPKDLPEHVRMAAWNRIYKESLKRNGVTRQTLEKYMPEPLINRIGEQNIIWFAPLTFKAVRELTLAKTNGYLGKLKPADGRRGWDVGFQSASDHERVIEIFEREGFMVEEQGAAIDRYVDQAVNKDLRALLLANKVDTGARVALAPRVDQSEEQIKKTGKVLLDVIVEGKKERLTLALHAKKREKFPRENKIDQVMTAIHETGHEFVGRLLLGDKHKSNFITVIPGVTEINGEWIYYAGLRSSEVVERVIYTKEAVERVIAGLLAGEVAQTIFSKGQRHDAGKSNDIERATQIARRAVGEWGLSSAWGNRSMSKQELDSMSDADKQLFNTEVNKILNRARNLAYNTILKNREVFSELASDLVVKGEIRSKGLEEFYEKNASRIVEISDAERDSTRVEAKLLPAGFNDPNYRKSHNVEVADFFKVPEAIADIEVIVKNEKAVEVAKARKPKTLPIFSSFNDISEKPVLVLSPERVEKQVKPELVREANVQEDNSPGAACRNLFR